MKRILIILAVLGIYQNWHKIERVINPREPVQHGQNAVTIYTTSWCGYCKKAKKVPFLMHYINPACDKGDNYKAAFKYEGDKCG